MGRCVVYLEVGPFSYSPKDFSGIKPTENEMTNIHASGGQDYNLLCCFFQRPFSTFLCVCLATHPGWNGASSPKQLTDEAVLKGRQGLIWGFTTNTPAIPDVFDSGRNVGALRPARRVGFRSLGPGGHMTFPGDLLFFVTPIAL